MSANRLLTTNRFVAADRGTREGASMSAEAGHGKRHSASPRSFNCRSSPSSARRSGDRPRPPLPHFKRSELLRQPRSRAGRLCLDISTVLLASAAGKAPGLRSPEPVRAIFKPFPATSTVPLYVCGKPTRIPSLNIAEGEITTGGQQLRHPEGPCRSGLLSRGC